MMKPKRDVCGFCKVLVEYPDEDEAVTREVWNQLVERSSGNIETAGVLVSDLVEMAISELVTKGGFRQGSHLSLYIAQRADDQLGILRQKLAESEKDNPPCPTPSETGEIPT